jgi:hydroxyacylglutathione hydrolase
MHLCSSFGESTMLKIDALPAFNDNYIWLLQDPVTQRCAAVDPGDAQPVLDWLEAHPGWELSDILITHHHPDHVGGIQRLKANGRVRVMGPSAEQIPQRDLALTEGQGVDVLGYSFNVLEVPGHTLGHIAYFQPEQHWLFCGDTLFAGGCGRLFEGSPEQMHASLQRLAALPDDSLIYCTHEYTLSNLRFAAAVEPHNAEIQARLQQVTEWRANDQISLPSNLALEKVSNPFLRTHDMAVQKIINEREGQAQRSPSQVFAALRAWKDHF